VAEVQHATKLKFAG